MAGNYPDVPAPRMAYDRDGTQAYKYIVANASITQLTGAQIAEINDEDNGSYQVGEYDVSNGQVHLVVYFPQLRNISGVFLGAVGSNGGGGTSPGSLSAVEWSANSTNPIDGTWTAVAGVSTNANPTSPAYRTSIQTVSLAGVKAIRFRIQISTTAGGSSRYDFRAVNFYGEIAAGETPDRLRMWHPTLDEPLDDNNSADGAYFDWGNIQRNTTSDLTFRIKNNSSTLTANSVVVSQQTLTDTSPIVRDMFTFSDGGAFTASLDIGSLPPAAISSVITKRFARPSNAVLSLWAARTIANPTSWS